MKALLGRLHALLLLTAMLIRTLLRRWLGRRRGLRAFRANYAADRLYPVTARERESMRHFGRCIACGLCDRTSGTATSTATSAQLRVMDLALAEARSLPDFVWAARDVAELSDAALAQRERICPTHVPLRQLARFVVARRDPTGLS